ncbi:MAG: hypothetical protein ACT4QE_19260 [Anaerolineales bacterium]
MTASISRHRAPAPPIGIVASLTAGFEVVNARLVLVTLPLVLDLLLWLGPRLSIKPIVDETLALMDDVLAGSAGATPGFELLRNTLTQTAELFNLFSALSTRPLGLPSLIATRGAPLTPFGQPLIWPIVNPWVYVVLFGAFLLLGLLLGALYFGGIAQQVRDSQLNLVQLVRGVWGDWLRLSVLAVAALILVFMIGGPTVVMAQFAALVSPLLGAILSVLGATLILWVLIFGAFSVHGIVLQRRGLFGALWDSVRLVQSSLPQTAGLFAAVMVLNLGLGLVWNVPTSDSWLMLVGVAGHALVSTALIAATFAFYKDRYRWWLETQQALKKQTDPKGL